MNLKRAIGRQRTKDEDDLNITPVMNIFLILVPFLLLTAVFVKISILEFSLPGSQAAAKHQGSPPVLAILAIRDSGFELKVQGKSLPFIARQNRDFDFAALVTQLKQIKERFAETEDIILAPEAAIKYDTLIKVMDRCREQGFVNISISG